MSKTGRVFAGIVVVMLAASSVVAEEGHHTDSKKHLDQLSKKLELTDAQRTQVEQIMNEYHGRLEALEGQMEALKAEKREKINAVLNPAQQEKFKKMQHHKGNHGWLRQHER